MKLVQYTDEDGFLQQSLIQDKMKTSQAHYGIPHNPPDLRQLDWDAIVRELNEKLIKQNLITLSDVATGALSNTILRAIQPKIVDLYKQQAYAIMSNGQNEHNQNEHNNDQANSNEAAKELNNAKTTN